MMITETKLADRRQMVTPELKLTKKGTADKEGAGPQLPRIVAEKPREIEVVRDTRCLHRWEKRQTM